MKWKGLRRKRPWPHFKVLFHHSPGGYEENHENPRSVKPDSVTGFEQGNSRIRRSVNHSTTTFVESMSGCCEHGNGTSGSGNVGVLLD
jgi:hypothetical protein